MREAEISLGRKDPVSSSAACRSPAVTAPAGPSGAKNFSTMLGEALNERVIVAEDARRCKITERKVIVTQVVNRAAKGDWHDTKLVLDIEKDIERQADAAAREAANVVFCQQSSHRTCISSSRTLHLPDSRHCPGSSPSI